MRTTYYENRRGGHCPGHIRDTFLAALDAYAEWENGEPEPTIEHEVGRMPRTVTLSQACGLVWNCSDILPSHAVSTVEMIDLNVQRRTYAAVARAMRERINKHLA